MKTMQQLEQEITGVWTLNEALKKHNIELADKLAIANQDVEYAWKNTRILEKARQEQDTQLARLAGQTQFCPMCEDYARKIEVARDALKVGREKLQLLANFIESLDYESDIDGEVGSFIQAWPRSVTFIDAALAALSPNAVEKELIENYDCPIHGLQDGADCARC